jgi:hypothetical protein
MSLATRPTGKIQQAWTIAMAATTAAVTAVIEAITNAMAAEIVEGAAGVTPA